MTLNYMLERSEGNNKDALLNKIAEIKHPSHHILSTLMVDIFSFKHKTLFLT